MRNKISIISFCALAALDMLCLPAAHAGSECSGKAAWCSTKKDSGGSYLKCEEYEGTKYKNREGECVDTPVDTFFYNSALWSCVPDKNASWRRYRDSSRDWEKGQCCETGGRLGKEVKCKVPQKVEQLCLLPQQKPEPDSSSGQCVSCPSGQEWNGSSCACPIGQNWDGSSCVTCRPGQKWDEGSKKCLCPGGASWNSATNSCCPRGMPRYDVNKKQCTRWY